MPCIMLLPPLALVYSWAVRPAINCMWAIDLHNNHPVLEFSFGGAFEELIYFLLNSLADLFPAAFRHIVQGMF